MGVLDCIGMRVLGQMRHAKSRSVRRAEGFGVCFWLKISKKSRNAFGKMEVLDCFFCVNLVKSSIFSHSVKIMHTESSGNPQTCFERLTRDRSLVLHARLVKAWALK